MNGKQREVHDKIAHALDTVLNVAFIVAFNFLALGAIAFVSYKLTRWFLS